MVRENMTQITVYVVLNKMHIIHFSIKYNSYNISTRKTTEKVLISAILICTFYFHAIKTIFQTFH